MVMAGSLQRGAAGRRRGTWPPEGDASSAFAARAAGRRLADLEVGHGRRARCERGAGGPEATACTVLFAEACVRWPAVIFRARRHAWYRPVCARLLSPWAGRHRRRSLVAA